LAIFSTLFQFLISLTCLPFLSCSQGRSVAHVLLLAAASEQLSRVRCFTESNISTFAAAHRSANLHGNHSRPAHHCKILIDICLISNDQSHSQMFLQSGLVVLAVCFMLFLFYFIVQLFHSLIRLLISSSSAALIKSTRFTMCCSPCLPTFRRISLDSAWWPGPLNKTLIWISYDASSHSCQVKLI
jgi:hypothetical protein